jgi:glycerophosphoryl diester phosphodiesterase
MKIIAHRGASQVAPENTMPAFLKAIQAGADAIELDVQMTRDNQVIVIHDEWLNRTTDGHGFVCNMTAKSMRQLDAGSWFHPTFANTKVPLLAEVLDFVSQKGIAIHIELKNNLIPYPGLENEVIQLIRQFRMENSVVLSSFRFDSLYHCQHLAPHIRRGFLCWNVVQILDHRDGWKELELFSVHPHISMLSASLRPVYEEGLRIYPYVVERKSQLQQCVTYGVDGFFTNSPRQAKRLLLKNRL